MSWLSHEIHALEAAGIRYVVNSVIVPNEAKIEALAGEAPAGVDALVALVEQKDAALGAVAKATIDAVVNTFKPQIEAEIQALVTQGATVGIPTLIAALNNVATKLEAN